MDDTNAEISALKQQARDELAKIRAAIRGGNVPLSASVADAIVRDSKEELDGLLDIASDDTVHIMLKDKGVPRKQRRALVAGRRDKSGPTVPTHTKRAQAVANRRALERASR
jgi:hypothetical protein